MKKQLLFIATVMLALSLQAQNEPVVIVRTTGKVGLISQGKSKARPVEAGAVAQPTSKLKLPAGAKATILCAGQFKEVAGGQTLELSSICGNKSSSVTLDADHDFAEKVMAAVEMVAVAKKRGDGWSNAVTDPKKSGDGWGTAVTDPKKSGDGWGTAVTDPKKSGDGWGTAVTDPKKSGDGWGTAVTDPKKSGDGWGGKGSAIKLIMPFGKVSASKITFNWSRPANKEPYHLEIKDEAGKVVHSVNIQDTFAVIDLKTLNLTQEQVYSWKVSVSGSTAMVSKELEFGVGSDQDWESTLKQARSSALSKSSLNPSISALIEAVALEEAEWFYAAEQTYASMAQKSPDNLFRMMHSAFWARYGFRRLAVKAAQGYW
jgi:hypothetical protein